MSRARLVFLFAAYAVLIWYLVAKRRRRFAGFAIAIGGALLAAAITWLFGTLVFTGGRYVAPAVRGYQLAPLWLLMWAETIIVGVVGLFIACLPRRPAGHHCPRCWYDTRGLAALVCPECGAQLLEAAARPATQASGAGDIVPAPLPPPS